MKRDVLTRDFCHAVESTAYTQHHRPRRQGKMMSTDEDPWRWEP